MSGRAPGRADLEKWARILGLPGDLGGLTDEQLLDRIAALIIERREAVNRMMPGGLPLPRVYGGSR